MRAKAAAALALASFCVAARAEDLGEPVTFASRASASFRVQAFGGGPRVVFDSGVSDPVVEPWDTVLIQGFLPEPAVTFEACRGGGAPTDCSPLEMHRFPNGRFWARAKVPRGSGALELRAIDTGSSRDSVVDIYAIEAFVDAPAPPPVPDPAPRGSQDPSAPRPFVHSRAEWNAAVPTGPYTPDPIPWRATLHHSDGRYTRTLAESLDEARFIQDFHIHGRGWIDIAYHFLVDPLGNVIEGRPEGTLGAHTLANNEGNVGIVLLGNYHPPVNNRPTAAQLAAVAALGRYLVARYGIAPSSLKGHRDYKQTECPGNLAYSQLAALRKAFAAPAKTPPAMKILPPLAFSAPDFDGAAASR